MDHRQNKEAFKRFLSALLLMLIVFQCAGCDKDDLTPAENMWRYNVEWATPSKDPSGVVPIGNGDIAAGVYDIKYTMLVK